MSSRFRALFATPKKEARSKQEAPAALVFPLFEKSPPMTQKKKKKQKKAPSPPAGRLPTLSLRAAEGVRLALDLLDATPAVLETEGLWRACGVVSAINTLAAELIAGDCARSLEAHLAQGDVNEVIGAVKAVLKRHQPLTTYEMCAAFVRGDDERSLLSELPPINRQTLCRLALHFDRLLKHADTNRMSWRALSVALAPTLLRRDEAALDSLEAVERAKADAAAFPPAVERLLKALAPAARRPPPPPPPKTPSADATSRTAPAGSASTATAILQAAQAAHRAGHTKSWRIANLQQKHASSASQKTAARPPRAPADGQLNSQRRIVRAFTSTSPIHHLSSPRRLNPSFSVSDLELAAEDDPTDVIHADDDDRTPIITTATW
ncbi:hypothetical protein CTAYLR_002345 [Chrysophaeum taylorii]|uniref:Rho-GAP domain-containing protein n=1 Tax=Chrysophaeum taylorii TaxID=2483200 RepID=A0AAD7XN44_9STRA|nr:hypothetical protein CTAYLR_002345 [Chrysophaeum taylorii]